VADSTSDKGARLTLEQPQWTLNFDTKFKLELSHNA
jgi:hypothetical protein